MAETEKTTVRMKFVGHFKGKQKIVELPIPLISNSMKLEETLIFAREKSTGPAFCDVPMAWVGALLDVGGNWQLAEKVTAATQALIDQAKVSSDALIKKLALDNDVVMA